jgi:hypothetical protein
MVKVAGVLLALVVLGLCIEIPSARCPEPTTAGGLNPLRVVVVIGRDWHIDPNSYVEAAAGNSDPDRSEGAFHDVVSLLKLWSVPFDILRLDQNHLNLSQFLDSEGKLRYGAIVWDCNQAEPLGTQNWTVLEEAVGQHGISLVALANTIQEPRIRELLGIELVETGLYPISDPFNITVDHFITQGYNGTIIPAGTFSQEGSMGGKGCHVTVNETVTTILGSQGTWPQLTVRDLTNSTKAVWIGGNRNVVFSLSPVMASILRRALTYCIGYLVYKTYPNTVVLRLDDMGTSQSAYLSSWHYPQLTAEQINYSITQPLLEHNATVSVMYCAGYPTNTSHSVNESWTVDWVDYFGTEQNLTSNYIGILDGMSRGVLEIQSHGWTHLNPDLDSPPGPWWDNQTEWEDDTWYREARDERRGYIDIASAIEMQCLNNSVQETQKAFGTFPLSFAPSGSDISADPAWNGRWNLYDNFTYEIAGLAGFGIASDQLNYHYLGPKGDIIVYQMRMTRLFNMVYKPDVRARLKTGWDIPVYVVLHDMDLVQSPGPNYLNDSLKQLEEPSTETENAVETYLSENAFSGYLHSNTSSLSSSIGFAFSYDSHYCKYFADHESRWTLDLSNESLQMFRSLGTVMVTTDSSPGFTVNASTYFNETQTLTIPQGIGTHTIQFESAFVFHLSAGWNMISFPVIPNNSSFASIFNGAGYYQILTWSGTSYVTPADAEAGCGYWALVLGDTELTVSGQMVESYETSLPAGWSMIGSVYGKTVNASDVFGNDYYQLITWSGTSYVPATTIEPGKGYWALVLVPKNITVDGSLP